MRLIRENAYRDVWLLVITAFVIWALVANANESARRRDQACTLFERQYAQDVRNLFGTYHYLQGLSSKDLLAPINQAIVANVPNTEDQAKAATPPTYCAPSDVGLKQPIPDVPARPADLKNILPER